MKWESVEREESGKEQGETELEEVEMEKERKGAGRKEVVYLRVCFTVYSDRGLSASGCWFPSKEQWLASISNGFSHQPKGHP